MTAPVTVPPRDDVQAPVRARRILAIDPGSKRSGWLVYDTEQRRADVMCAEEENDTLLKMLRTRSGPGRTMAIEICSPWGKMRGDLIETIVVIGRCVEAWQAGGGDVVVVARDDIKLHLLGRRTGSDADVKSVLEAMHGGSERAAKGTVAAPGPLFGIKNHVWQALAVAVTVAGFKPAPFRLEIGGAR